MTNLDWAEAWGRLDASRRERLGRAVGRLLEEGLVLKGPPLSPDPDYRCLEQYEEAAREYLRAIGWNLSVDRAAGFVQAKNAEGRCRVRLSKDESVVLCVLRLLFQERVNQSEQPEIIDVSIAEIQEAYRTHTDGKRPLGKVALVSALRRMQQLKLVRLPAPFQPDPVMQVELLPTLQAALPNDSLKRTAERLRQYLHGRINASVGDVKGARTGDEFDIVDEPAGGNGAPTSGDGAS